MELWIRSQDKEMLTKIDYIYLSVPTGKEVLGGNHYMINKSLGLYKTKERALEVLDEIQEYINNNCEFIERKSHTSMGTYTNKITMKVYEMPKE